MKLGSELTMVRMGRLPRTLVLSVLLGLCFLGFADAATHEPWGASDGYPLRYSYPNLPCTRPNPFNGCGYSYDPLLVGLDFLFWLAIAVFAVSAIDQAWKRFLSPQGKSATQRSASNGSQNSSS